MIRQSEGPPSPELTNGRNRSSYLEYEFEPVLVPRGVLLSCKPGLEQGDPPSALSSIPRSPFQVQSVQGRVTSMSKVDSGERGANVRFPPPLIYLAFILLGVALRYVTLPPNPVDGFITRAAGVAIILAGLWLIVEAWKLFKRTGQDPKPWTPSPEMVLSGPYRFTRNPMYVGMTCIQLGLGLALNNLWISFFAAFSLLTVHFMAVVPEEKYLAGKFGESYTGYVIKVRRYL